MPKSHFPAGGRRSVVIGGHRWCERCPDIGPHRPMQVVTLSSDGVYDGQPLGLLFFFNFTILTIKVYTQKINVHTNLVM